MQTIKQILIDIRDYAYLWSEKQEEGRGEFYLTNKLFSLYGFYWFMLVFVSLYSLKLRYDLEFIKNIKTPSPLIAIFYGIFLMYLPFRIIRFLLGKFINTPLPVEGVDDASYKHKRKVFWIVFSIPFIVLAIYIHYLVNKGYMTVSPTNFNIFK